MENIQIAVNGTLMRGLGLNQNLCDAGGEFVAETATASCYRLWSINDSYPAMMRDNKKGKAIRVEVWRLPLEGLVRIIEKEPPGLCLGRVELQDQSIIFGILGEDYICADQKEITGYGGWREYLKSK